MMAKLSKRQSRHVSFLLHKMALSYGHDERQELLSKLLDALHIDDEQRAESADDAKRSVRHDARRQRPAKPADPIDTMNLDEITAHNREMLTKLKRLLEERRAEQKPDVYAMSDEERAAYQDDLLRKLQPTATPEPAPIVEEAPTYDVTAKQRRRLAAFDDMSDADQIDQLASLWGNDGKAVQP